MATTSGDSDSDYGWDLSPEEERKLESLVTRLPPSTPSSTLTSTARLSRQPGKAGPSLKADIKAASGKGKGKGVAASEATRSLLDDEKDHRDFADLDPGFSHYNEAGVVPRNAIGMATMVAANTGPRTRSASLLEKAASHSSRLPAEDDDVSYPDLSSALSNITYPEADAEQSELEPPSEVGVPLSPTKTPLARFRTFPKKPFSVTELATGAWCELQHEYTLTMHRGRKTRTAAMKAGTRLHQTLEDEVHTTVKVQIAKKEDAFGLKLWNIIQGLRTLRDTGLTREMEVWGFVDGHVVNGLIDGLSYEHPDPEFEEEYRASQESSQEAQAPSSGQSRITTFFATGKEAEPKPDTPPHPKVYLTDVKTRGTSTMPTGAAVRPTKIQLFLYHRFLSEMADGKLDYLHVIRRYGLDPDEPFSDEFLAEIGSLHDELFYDSRSSSSPQTIVPPPRDTSSPPDLVKYHSLRSLLPLVKEEFRITFPMGAASVGTCVAVDYRLRPRYTDEGVIDDEEIGRSIGQNIIPVHAPALDSYLDRYMQWWRGERAAKGVDIEEAALKCRSCEFKEICTWRKEQDEERLRAAKEKLQAKKKAAVDAAAADKRPKRKPRMTNW